MAVSVLTEHSQITNAAQRLHALGLVPHRYPAKNWDVVRMLERILAQLGDRRRDAAILDVGCQWCPMLPRVSLTLFMDDTPSFASNPE